jgi:tetratricopeptide (TPR) repeat protein
MGLKEAAIQAAVDSAYLQAIRSLLETVGAGREPANPPGGAFGHLIAGAGSTAREAVGSLAERWFGAPRLDSTSIGRPPILNDERVAEVEKVAAVLIAHIGQRRPWTALSTNESTFYRYRRLAIAQFVERSWVEVTQRPIPTNRPRPDFERFVGRTAEQAEIIRWLAGGPGSVIGIEGPGGAGKTALAHAIVDVALAAAHRWDALTIGGNAVPVFDAVVWIANRQTGLSLGDVLDVLARTLDYPGLLGREVADRRSALREVLGRQAVLIVVDDADRADPGILSFLLDLPSPSRALVTTRRKLPPRVVAIAPGPLEVEEALALVRAEGARQAVPPLVAAQDAALRPLADSARRFPLLAVWAAGQLRQGQTVERVQARLAHAEGGVFQEMFAGSVQALGEDGRRVLKVLPTFVRPVTRPAIIAAALNAANPDAGIDELLEASLLEATEGLTDDERRYALHPVARAFVRRHLPIAPDDERFAFFGALAHYRRLAETFAGSVRHWASFDRIEREIENILALSESVSRAATEVGEPGADRFDAELVALAHGLRNFFWLRHYWREGLDFFHRAVDASRRLGDFRALGWNTYSLAYLHYELGTAGYREARARAAEAVEVLRRAGDERGVGHAMRLLGRAARERGDFDEAWRLLGEASAVLTTHGRGDDLIIVRASQADLLRRQGRLDEAAGLYLDVLGAGLDDPGTRANVLHNLGDVRLRQGGYDVAEGLFRQGESIAATVGARGLVAECRWGLAQVAFSRGDARRCLVLATEAADLFERLGESERAAAARELASLRPSSH